MLAISRSKIKMIKIKQLFMYKIFYFLVFILSTIKCFPQVPASVMKSNHFFDGAISFGNKRIAPAIGWAHLHGIGKKKQKLKIGYGVRITSFNGKNQDYITASAKVVKGVTGPAVFAKKPILENIDTLMLERPQVNAINLNLQLQYSFTNRFDVGFNIDLVGFSFGPSRSAILKSSDRRTNLSSIQEATPTSFNLLLGADNDIGTLNSEFYGKYWITKRIAIKGGFSHLFTEYTSKADLPGGKRFRNISNLIFVGVSFSPYRFIVE